MSDESKMPLPGSLQEIAGSLLFASETPLTVAELREAIRAVEPEEGENAEIMEVYHTCTTREVEAALKGLDKALEVAGCGFRLVCSGGAYRMQTVPSCGRYVRAMLKLDRPSRLGRASLETLAIVAYRQPITKGEVEEIRGVDVSGNIKTLMDLQLIRLVGKSELPGHPFLYGTTPLFLEHFGLASLQQLNELDPTLQRSNPREKAASYKKPVSQEPLPLEDAQQQEDKQAEQKTQEAAESPDVAESTESSEAPEIPAAQPTLYIDEDEEDVEDEFDEEDEEDEDEELDDEDEELDDEDEDEEDEFDEDDDEEDDEDEEDEDK